MTFSHDAVRNGRNFGAWRAKSQHLSPVGDDWDTPPEQQTDWKKVLLLTGLGALSWISTYTGMLELIQANMGEVAFVYKAAIGFAVVMLMLMIVWLLDQLFARINWSVRLLFVFGYLFLTLISVGFGFGFYWKFLESRSEATRSASSAVTQVQSALVGAQTRLEQLQTTLDMLTTISASKAAAERDKGNSCPNSRPGDGPRRRLRDADAKHFAFAGDFVRMRIGTVKSDIEALNTDLAKVTSRAKSTFDPTSGTRNGFMKALSRKLDMAVTRFNAFRTDPQLRQFRNDFAERSAKTIFPNGKSGTFTCPDPQLQTALHGVVRAIDQLPNLEKPKIATVEGSEAIIEAFRRLTTTIYGALQLKLPPSPDELRALQQRAVQSVENVAAYRRAQNMEAGLGKRDYIPLFIAIFVDFCLLLVSVSRPMNEFLHLDHKMREAQEWPIIRILSRFREIHSDEELRQVFDVFRHVVFDWRGVYYAAIPVNGTNPTRPGLFDDEDAALEARLLGNLFTSFECDRIYRRVPVPMFRTRFVQKKLSQQGSKFAQSEAFRIYRFNHESWSNWILGAIMGAAKRVEAARRTRAMEDELFGRPEPVMPARAPAATPQAPRPRETAEPIATPHPANDHGTRHTEPPIMRARAATPLGEAPDEAPDGAPDGAPAWSRRMTANGHAPGGEPYAAPHNGPGGETYAASHNENDHNVYNDHAGNGSMDAGRTATVIHLPGVEQPHAVPASLAADTGEIWGEIWGEIRGDMAEEHPPAPLSEPEHTAMPAPIEETPSDITLFDKHGDDESLAHIGSATAEDPALQARVRHLRADFDAAISGRSADILGPARQRETEAVEAPIPAPPIPAPVVMPATPDTDSAPESAARDAVPVELIQPIQPIQPNIAATGESTPPMDAQNDEPEMLRLPAPAKQETPRGDLTAEPEGLEWSEDEDIDVESISQWFGHDRVVNGKAGDA